MVERVRLVGLPTLFAYDIQGEAAVAKQAGRDDAEGLAPQSEYARNAGAVARPKASDYARGSIEDRLGNRGGR